MGLPQHAECDHCGYVSEEETGRLCAIGDEGAWICPSCSVCNTTRHIDIGYITQLGYQRNLEVGYV